MRKVTLLLTLLSVLFLASMASAEPLVKTGDRVWLIGDSNGWLLMHELPEIAKKSGVELGGNPVGGASVYWWLQKQHRDSIHEALAFQPDVVLVVLGTNEAHFPMRSIETMPDLFAKLFTYFHMTSKVVLVGPPTMPRKVETRAARVRTILRNFELPFLDSSQITMPMWADKIHPSVPGRKKWAAWLWKKLTSEG